jgi:hypothetical protein
MTKWLVNEHHYLYFWLTFWHSELLNIPQMINSHQQMHQNKFVTDFFIKSLPQYAFRHFYIAIIRGVVGVFEQRLMFFVTSEQLRQYSLLPLCIKLYKIVQ